MSAPTLPELRAKLAASLATKRRLYLDLLYWNHLCDVELGVSRHPEHAALLMELRDLVRGGVVVCPIEFTVFTELYKQRLPEKRVATARLIDELSGGVSLVSPMDRCMIEALRLIEGLASETKTAPISPPFGEVWTKVAFLLGHGRVRAKGLSPEMEEHIDGLFRQHLWTVSLEELCGHLGDDLPVSFSWAEDMAVRLNREKIAARASFPSQRAIYLAELRGALDVYREQLGEILPTMFRWVGGDVASVTAEHRATSARVMINAICAIAEKTGIAACFPSLHIQATLFSHVQWDEKRKYKANDIQDFAHASAALAYCDAFATERSLGSLVTQAKLDAQYGTVVLPNTAALRDWLATVHAI